MKIFSLAIVVASLSTSMFAQSQPAKTQLSSLVLDNKTVKVTAFEGQPGKDMCGLGKHSHGAHLTVMLTEATVTVTLPDGKVMTQKMPAGTTFWSEAETHTVINSGKSLAKAQIIEYKKQK